MLEELIALLLPLIISICELMGIFVVAVSAARAFWNYCKGLVTHVPLDVKFDLANGLATSLEFKNGGRDPENRVGTGSERIGRLGGGRPAAGTAVPADPL